jgi:hypothetical protein
MGCEGKLVLMHSCHFPAFGGGIGENSCLENFFMSNIGIYFQITPEKLTLCIIFACFLYI